jgi:FG-GAP repeat
MMIIFSRNLQIFCLIATLVVLSACSQPSPANVPNEPKETPLITDADIDRAKLQIATSSTNIVGIEGGEASPGELLAPLADSQGDLSTQAVLPNTSGFVYYVRSTLVLDGPILYQVFRHNQKTDAITLLYSGIRAIQSVAGSLDGKVIVVSMRETTAMISDYEIYAMDFSLDPVVVQITSDTVNNTNVSMSGDTRRIIYQEPVSAISTIIFRNKILGFNYDRVVLSASESQRQPSLNGSGSRLALVRDLATGSDRVLVYDIAANIYTTVSTSTALLEYPTLTASTSELKVSWLENGATTDRLLLKNLTAVTLQTVASGSSLNHPHLTADGAFITYQSGNSIVTKDLSTAQVVTIASSPFNTISVYAPMWQRPFDNKFIGTVAGNSFGSSVSVSNNFMVVSAPYENNQLGAAYIYQRNTLGIWTFVKKLLASDGVADDYFGTSVSISGNTVVVGAEGESHDTDGNGTIEEDVGAAYIFQKDQGGTNTWGQVKKLIASDGAEVDYFGVSVSISSSTVVVGAYAEVHDTNGDASVGAAYIFSKDQDGTNNWGQVKKLIASDGAEVDYFGNTVSISSNTVVVGASNESHDTDGNGTQESNVGAAYIFSKDQGGTNTWGQVKKLIASDGAANDQFGWSVSISGSTVVVGTYGEDHNIDGITGDEVNVGAAYVFQKEQGGTNNWGQVKKLIASDGAANDGFGTSISISGNTIVVGAFFESHDTDGNSTDELGVGAAYLFQKDQGGTNTWGQIKKLMASDGATFDYFGHSVAISSNTVVVGADGDDNLGGTDAGAVYIYEQ